MRFTKMEGLGNDYIYVNLFEENLPMEKAPELARRVADVHFGIGSDGLILIAPSKIADVRMVMYNVDGTRGEMCGNATRCVGKYCYERGLVKKEEIRMESDAGIRTMRLTVESGIVTSITVDMGAPETNCAVVPCTLCDGEAIAQPIRVLDRIFEITPISMGNPHGVILLDESLDSFPLEKYGPLVEHHEIFPERANIEFVNVLNDHQLRMRVWERGSGITMACGTGASASLAAAVLCGKCGKEAEVILDGGSLAIRWAAETGHIFMTGPARFI